ncbi:MAG: hypothetical protein R2749_29360 [Acidimicrobiales bacterium]
MPSTTEFITDPQQVDFGKVHGYPSPSKAAYSGGRRGMVVPDEASVTSAIESAQRGQGLLRS